MSDHNDQAVGDHVDNLRNARKSPAVLKHELATARAVVPDFSVLVFEGDDDKIVYSQWLRRIRANTRYLMFPCNGKGRLLSLRQSILLDRTGLNKGVYFFVDRDFDDLRDQEAGPDIFMTDKYSIENYMVCEEVLETILEVEFHCHSERDVRDAIVMAFSGAYQQFLEVTTEINRRLYVARKLRIDVKALPTSIGKIALVKLITVRSGSLKPEEAVSYLSEPEPDKVESLIEGFRELKPRDRFRGKFALLFFFQWLRELAAEGDLERRGVFAGLNNKASFRLAELTLNTFASRSPMPEGFANFIAAIP